jgi:predicted ATP-dependent serine protease
MEIHPRAATDGGGCWPVHGGPLWGCDIDQEEVTLSLPLDNSLLEREIVEHEIALVVIDPIMSVISDRIDTHVTRDVRRALDPLAKMADRTGAVILGIAHFNKASGTDAATLLSGSHHT